MKSLQRFVIIMFGLFINVTTSILVMIYGWGLQPKSWAWIIGVYLLGHSIAIGLVEISKH